MSSTFTFGIRSFRLPKLNANLLSAISLMLLLSMALLAVPAFADDCEDERQAVRDAAKALGEALANLVTAIAAGDEAAIAEAQAAAKEAVKNLIRAIADLWECVNSSSGNCG